MRIIPPRKTCPKSTKGNFPRGKIQDNKTWEEWIQKSPQQLMTNTVFVYQRIFHLYSHPCLKIPRLINRLSRIVGCNAFFSTFYLVCSLVAAPNVSITTFLVSVYSFEFIFAISFIFANGSFSLIC